MASFRFRDVLCLTAVVVALICSLLLGYGASYFHLSSEVATDDAKVRVYGATWMLFLFAPAACVESQITGEEVRVAAKLPPRF
jgi:hypothetical protein